MAAFTRRILGATGREVGPIGLGSSYGLPGREVERAFERGVDFFLWGSMRKGDFGRGVREVARKDRARATIAIQTYARAAWTMPGSVERALHALRTDYVDILCLAWWNGLPRRASSTARSPCAMPARCGTSWSLATSAPRSRASSTTAA